MIRKPQIEVVKVVAIYTALAAFWILFSDRLLGLFVNEPGEITALQSVKGVAFVLATAVLLYALIARMERHLLRANRALQLNRKVLDNLREGVMVTDTDNRIVMVNDGFEQITGYKRSEVLGGNPSMLSSGRQPPEFYESLWAALQQKGHWQGEILNRRKSGEVFPERLSISTIRDEQDRVQYHIGIFADTTDEQKAREQIDFLARFDPLTQLPNRRTFRDRLTREVTGPNAPASSIVMALDLDRFKLVNDGMGYDIGNALLCEVARRMVASATGRDVVARQSSDEFLLFLPGRDLDQAVHFAERLLETISRPWSIDGQELSISCSIGIACYPGDGDSADELLQAADSALSLAKAHERNSYRFHDADSQARSLEYMKIEHGLRHAVDGEELELYLQPQYTAADGRLYGTEALIRWHHPELGLVSPGRFIPVAEESGQIITIGNWVLRKAVRHLREWREAGLTPVPLSVNLSVAHFRLPTLVDDIRALLEAEQVDPALLCLEITETVAMADAEHTLETIRSLEELGLRLALDDFGSGYSSFTYLRRLRVRQLKIDRSFIQELEQEDRDRAIVQSIIGLAHSLGFETLAEGVETDGQLRTLQAMDCDGIQGFLFARPMPEAAFREQLAASDG